MSISAQHLYAISLIGSLRSSVRSRMSQTYFESFFNPVVDKTISREVFNNPPARNCHLRADPLLVHSPVYAAPQHTYCMQKRLQKYL